MKYIEIDFQYLMKIYYEFVNGIKKDDEAIAEEISKMIAEQAYEDIKQAYAQIINNWYASYSPLYYSRQYSLKNAGEISLQGTSVRIHMSSDPMGGHHLDNDGLYELTMRQGYHGGSMYRGPLYIWSHPTRKAVQTFSPVEAMKSWLAGYSNKSVYLLWSQIWAVLIFHENLSIQNIIGILVVLFGVWTVQRYE